MPTVVEFSVTGKGWSDHHVFRVGVHSYNAVASQIKLNVQTCLMIMLLVCWFSVWSTANKAFFLPT